MQTKVTAARKDHTCCLCFLKIPAGSSYERATIKPWDHPDNESFSTYKAHHVCDERWLSIGRDVNWMLPMDRSEWLEWIGETQ